MYEVNLSINKKFLLVLLITFIVIVSLAPDRRSLASAQISSQPEESSLATQGNSPESQKALQKYQEAQADPNLSDEEKIKSLVDAYFTTRYEGQAALARQDFSKYLKDASSAEWVAAAARQDFSMLVEDASAEWVTKENDKREIELYLAALFDLGYQSYKFTLDYDSIQINEEEAIVQLRESRRIVYNALAPDESRQSNLRHTLIFHDKKGVWVLYKGKCEDMLSEELDYRTKDEIKKQVNENFKNQFKTYGPAPETPAKPGVTPAFFTSNTYNRTAAVNYANIHAKARLGNYNTDWYETLSSDCTNYVSQALYAGENKAPPNMRGMPIYPRNHTNDWYNNLYDPLDDTISDPTLFNGSLSWQNVSAQYTFITGNTSRAGPYGEEKFLCYVNVGDIVQIYKKGTWSHAGILVSASTEGNCSDPNNYKINAHTDDRYQDTLAVWALYTKRFIHINGYRLDITIPARFADVPSSHWAFNEIDRLYDNGITGGCGTSPLRYCPGDNLTRAQMAIFLLRGIHGSSYEPPTAGNSTGFADVPVTHWAAKWIKQLYAENITGGCANNPNRFCPEEPVTHAQMAIFLLRSKNGASYAPPPLPQTEDGITYSFFYDIPTSYWAAEWIHQMAFEGISYAAHDCSSGNFCPESPVSRAEMASMLTRAFGLP